MLMFSGAIALRYKMKRQVVLSVSEKVAMA